MTKAAATTNLAEPCRVAASGLAYRKTSTPAMTNQYGETYTGMPNGRPMTIPGPASRRCGGLSVVVGGFSGVVLATLPMLRALLAAEIPPNVGGVPYGGRCE